MGRVRCCIFLQVIFCIFISFSARAQTGNLAITNVSVSSQILKAKNETAYFHFTINKPGSVTIKIYDALGGLVWQSQVMQLPKGGHSIGWNGRDQKEESVAPESYYYTIETRAADDEFAMYDLTDITGGESITLQDIRYDSRQKKLKFTAPKTGRYILRAGIAKAFAINTLINNKVVIEGEHELAWDGFDASHMFDASGHPQLQFGSFGYVLSSNLIVVRASDEEQEKIYKSRSWSGSPSVTEYRKRTTVNRENISASFYRPVNQSRDVLLLVTLPEAIKKNANGAYIIQAETSLRIDVLPEDIMVMEAQRGEIVLFLDNQLIHDNEVSYYPYNFKWNPKVYDGQEHFLTAFVAGFAGNIGIATLKIKLEKSNKDQ